MQLDDYSRRNMQDAPRLKAILKGCTLPEELTNGIPEGLHAIVQRSVHRDSFNLDYNVTIDIQTDGIRPSTTVVNLIFWMFYESNVSVCLVKKSASKSDNIKNSGLPVATSPRVSVFMIYSSKTLGELSSLDLLAYFVRPKSSIPAQMRAEAFLWLISHFLNTPNIDLNPLLGRLEPPPFPFERYEAGLAENVDTQEELEFAIRMKEERVEFLKKFAAEKAAQQAEEDGR